MATARARVPTFGPVLDPECKIPRWYSPMTLATFPPTRTSAARLPQFHIPSTSNDTLAAQKPGCLRLLHLRPTDVAFPYPPPVHHVVPAGAGFSRTRSIRRFSLRLATLRSIFFCSAPHLTHFSFLYLWRIHRTPCLTQIATVPPPRFTLRTLLRTLYPRQPLMPTLITNCYVTL